MLEYKPIHYHVGNISRNNEDKNRRHIVLAAEYRSGEPLYEKRREILHDKHKIRTDVIYKEILLPENAPREYFNREALWNAIDEAETKQNKTKPNQARTAKDIEFFLSNDKDIRIKSQIAIAREHAIENFVTQGLCVDMCVHDDGKGKPHVHFLVTTRTINSDGSFSNKKSRELDLRKCISTWRNDWSERLSYEFERRGLLTRFFSESYKKRGIDREPTKFVHRGIYKSKLQTERVLENEIIKERNRAKELERGFDRNRDNNRVITRCRD